jgi:hypothetical protein
MEKIKFLTLPGLELRLFNPSARSQSLYGLSYPGYHIQFVLELKQPEPESNYWECAELSLSLSMACGSGTAQQHAASVDSAHKMEAAEIAIKVACYLPRDEINGHELGPFYCLCQTRACGQQRSNFRVWSGCYDTSYHLPSNPTLTVIVTLKY